MYKVFALKKLKAIVLFPLLFIGVMSSAQDSTNSSPRYGELLRYEPDFIFGKTLNIHPFFPEVANAPGFEIAITKQTNGSKYWHQFYKYPTFGVSILGINLGNDSILGQAFGAYYFKEFPKKLGKHFEWNSRIGAGFGVFTKIYHPIDNPNNYVIGSRISGLGVAQSGFGFHVSPKFTIYGRVAFIHFSNGHYSVPNIGANIISGVFSIKYNLYSSDLTCQTHEVKPTDKKWLINLDLGLGMHEIEGTVLPSGGPKYPVYFGSIYTSKRIKNKALFSVGFNLNYFTAFHDQIINQQIFEDNAKAKSYKGVVFVGYEWLFGRMGFILQPGINVYYPFRKQLIEKELIHKRSIDLLNTNYVGFKFYTRSTRETTRYNPFIGFGLRTIGGKADFIETRIGMAF